MNDRSLSFGVSEPQLAFCLSCRWTLHQEHVSDRKKREWQSCDSEDCPLFSRKENLFWTLHAGVFSIHFIKIGNLPLATGEKEALASVVVVGVARR